MAVNCPQRSTSATVIQTLTFLNGAFVIDRGRHVAASRARWATLRQRDTDRAGLSHGLGRPRAEETEAARQFLHDQTVNYPRSGDRSDDADRKAWSELCHMLLCSNEFLYVD